MPRPSRKQQILETLTLELQRQTGKPITTAKLAAAAGVSEAALYRHFASKAQMFEALIVFAEESVFGTINQILKTHRSAHHRIRDIVYLLLSFCDHNQGIMRLLLGDALTGEHERLHKRTTKFFERIEAQLKQVLREGVLHGEIDQPEGVALTARLISEWLEGRMHRIRRGGFKAIAVDEFDQIWALILPMISYSPQQGLEQTDF